MSGIEESFREIKRIKIGGNKIDKNRRTKYFQKNRRN